MLAEKFTDCLEADDWKNAAAIVGLIRFFDYAKIPYNYEDIFREEETYGEDSEYWDGLDFLKFNAADITEEKLDEFIEYYFNDDMHHCAVEKVLHNNTEWSKEDIDFVNTKLTANTIMKKIFSKQKFDGSNQVDILEKIQNNRTEIIRETYCDKKNLYLYSNFCNENVFRKPAGDTVRLRGYYIDFAKKGKSISYRYDMGLFHSTDSIYYDFIPFAFTIGRESFFINDNSSIKQLVRTNKTLWERHREQKSKSPSGNMDTRKTLFENIIYAANFIDFDVEIIKKNMDKPYFETFYLRWESIAIFKQIENFKLFCRTIEIKNRNVKIHEEVTDAVINLQLMDSLIEDLLRLDIKEKTSNHTFLIRNIIRLNGMIRSKLYNGGGNMNQMMRSAYSGAENAVAVLKGRNQENKINSYRTKLLSALFFHDYDRFSEILLSLSNYTDVYFSFAYHLFEDFEANKEVAYTFVNNFNTRSRDKAADKGTDNRTYEEA